MRHALPALALVLAACDASVPAPEPEVDQRQPNAVFGTQIEAVDKARAVEGQVLDAAEAQRRQIEQAEQ